MKKKREKKHGRIEKASEVEKKKNNLTSGRNIHFKTGSPLP